MQFPRIIAVTIGILVWCGTTRADAPAAKGEATARPKTIVLSVGNSTVLRMSTRQPIKSVFNENDSVATVIPGPEPTSVVVKALAPGRTRITLVGEDGKKEVMTLGR